MSPEEAARLVGAVQAAASRCRPAKRVWEHLARDVLALLGGLRPCFMIDYAVLPPEFLDALVAALRRESPDPAADLHVLEIDGCFYPCKLAALLAALEAQLSARFAEFPALVVLSTEPAVASTELRAQLAARLAPLAGALRAALDRGAGHTLEGRQPCGGGWLIRVEDALGRSLTDPAGLRAADPLLPTINGWLLQYPVVYVVTPENASSAAAALSSAGLALFEMRMPCAAVSWGGAGRGGMDGSQPDVLYGYSAPAALADAVAAHDELGALRRRLADSEGSGGCGVWGQPRLEVTARPPGPVAL